MFIRFAEQEHGGDGAAAAGRSPPGVPAASRAGALPDAETETIIEPEIVLASNEDETDTMVV